MFDKLPDELKQTALFCLWRYEERGNSKPTKMPYRIDGARLRSTERGDFSPFAETVKQMSCYNGIGVGIFDRLCAVDIDHCCKDGALSDMAVDIINTMRSYTEYSPSGEGIRILFRADSSYEKAKYYINNQKLGLEIYVSGHTNKYVTLTGNRICGDSIGERSSELLTILDKYMLRPQNERHNARPVPSPSMSLSDAELVEKAMQSKNGSKFRLLWEGGIPSGKSHSEADAALCAMLSFWCGGDTEQMDRLFRSSGLYREKWEREDYRTSTLNNAVALTREFYKPYPTTIAVDDLSDVAQFLRDVSPENNKRYPWTDIGFGRMFADCYKGIARYVPERKSWYCYKDGVWSADTGSLRTMELCKELADRLMLYSLSITDEDRRKRYIDNFRKWQTRRTREIILKDAQSVHPISMREFDSDPYIFNCGNGTLHLDTMEFTPHLADDKLTKISEVIYDTNARCTRFEKFISEITNGNAELARFLQKAFGYGLSGDTRYECLFFLFGATTRNGKGTLCESVLKVIGNYGCTARPETLSIRQNTSSNTPSEDIARLAGVRFVNISEPGKGLMLNSAMVKSMTGNDTLNARFLHENSFDFKPQFKLYINTNYLPGITDMTLFSSGRVVRISFERHFDESEQDKSLKSEFAKPENQSAILNWLIEGYRLLCEEGLTPPDSVRDATAAYQHDSDKVAQFAEDCLISDPNAEVRTSEVYSCYKNWCIDNGHRAESMKNFKQSLMTLGTVTRCRPKNGGGDKTTLLLGFKLMSDFLG